MNTLEIKFKVESINKYIEVIMKIQTEMLERKNTII